MQQNYKNIIVKKPWGHEYQIFENDDIALWCLHIQPGCSTSLHAHSQKKTGLLLLNGKAEISFINDSFVLDSPSKVMIRQGLFHKTKNITKDEIIVFEIESPKNKFDLIRLEDCYGREGQPYEGSEYHTTDLAKHNLNNGYNNIKNYSVELRRYTDFTDVINKNYKYIMVLQGCVSCNKYHVVGPGDIISTPVFQRMVDNFDFNPMQILGIPYE